MSSPARQHAGEPPSSVINSAKFLEHPTPPLAFLIIRGPVLYAQQAGYLIVPFLAYYSFQAFLKSRNRELVFGMAQKCVHQGCGKQFTDPTEKCYYHPGPPVFHEGQKGT